MLLGAFPATVFRPGASLASSQLPLPFPLPLVCLLSGMFLVTRLLVASVILEITENQEKFLKVSLRCEHRQRVSCAPAITCAALLCRHCFQCLRNDLGTAASYLGMSLYV